MAGAAGGDRAEAGAGDAIVAAKMAGLPAEVVLGLADPDPGVGVGPARASHMHA
jgi:hypothetical protein